MASRPNLPSLASVPVSLPDAVHRLPSFGLECDLPVTAAAAGEVLSLPVYPTLTDDEVARVIDSVNAVAVAARSVIAGSKRLRILIRRGAL